MPSYLKCTLKKFYDLFQLPHQEGAVAAAISQSAPLSHPVPPSGGASNIAVIKASYLNDGNDEYFLWKTWKAFWFRQLFYLLIQGVPQVKDEQTTVDTKKSKKPTQVLFYWASVKF